MKLYAINAVDLSDLLALIAAPSLTIRADQAARVTQLQVLLRDLKPSTELEELKAAHAELNKTVDALDRVRNQALLDLGLERKRTSELEAALEVAKRELEEYRHAHPCAECIAPTNVLKRSASTDISA